MDEKAKSIIEFTLLKEGYYVNDKDDKGGETYRGISRVNFPKWEGWKIVDNSKPLKKGDKINSSELDSMILSFYYENFYTKIKAEQVNDTLVAAHLYDHGVNGGLARSVKLLQKAINNVYKANIKVDGMIGNVTLGWANKEKAKELGTEFSKQRISYYKDLTVINPTYKKFLDGWLNRVSDVNKKFS
jgi:lysozyme family protein